MKKRTTADRRRAYRRHLRELRDRLARRRVSRLLHEARALDTEYRAHLMDHR